MFHAYAAQSADSRFERYEYDPGDLAPGDVEVEVEYCGICHSDLSMWKNEWHMTQYPFVGGHEIAGRVAKLGPGVDSLQEGQRVGIGWTAHSCLHCDQCLSGYQNRCPDAVGTIVGRHGGFADRVRAQAEWVVPLPDGVQSTDCGPLFCGGLTVFNPLAENRLLPTGRIGVVGIGGLGHMALQFANAWGLEVTAFSTTPDKQDEAKELGAHHFINSKDKDALDEAAGRFDLILNTVAAQLPWDAYIAMLRPGGTLHQVGAAEKIEVTPFPMILAQRSLSASPTGSIVRAKEMLDFCARHQIKPQIETFPMSEINAAMDHLQSGKARYRIVLQAGK